MEKETKEEVKKDQVTDKEAEEFRDKANMKIFGRNIPKPFLSFKQAAFPGKSIEYKYVF